MGASEATEPGRPRGRRRGLVGLAALAGLGLAGGGLVALLSPAPDPVASAPGVWDDGDVTRFLFTRAELQAMLPDATEIIEDDKSWVYGGTTASPDFCAGAIAFGPDRGVDTWAKAAASGPAGAVISFGAAYDTPAEAREAFDRLRADRCHGGTIQLSAGGQLWDDVKFAELDRADGRSVTRISFSSGARRDRACVTNSNLLVCYSVVANDDSFATADGTDPLALGVARAEGLSSQ